MPEKWDIWLIENIEILRKVYKKMESLGDIDLLAKTFEDFQNGKLGGEKGFSAIASIEDIAKQDYILTPGRYVGIEEQKKMTASLLRKR